MVLAENTAILSFYKLEYKSSSAATSSEDSQAEELERPPSESTNVSVPHINPHRAKSAQ